MKYRLGASLVSLFDGSGGVRICKTLSFNHDIGQSNRNLLQGFESLRRSLHCFVCEEDEFSELGPSIAQGRGKLPKLMTEKPEPYLNRKALADRSTYAESHISARNVFLSLTSPTSALCPKPKKIDAPRLSGDSKYTPALPPKPEKTNIPRLSNDSECAPATYPESETNDINALLTDNEYANSISIENVPTTLDIIQLMQAISKYGKISSACMRTLADGLRCCDIGFENISSSTEAVRAGEIKIKKTKMPIRPFMIVQESITIRISGISNETTASIIHAYCKSIGPLKFLIKAGLDMDAIFSLKNDPDIRCILTKLNSTCLDNCKWSASLLPRNYTSNVKLKQDVAKTKLGSEIHKCLSGMKEEHSLKKTHIEDLQSLHSMITHLEGEYAVNC